MVPEVWSVILFLVSLDHFLPFYSPNNPEIQNFERKKNALFCPFIGPCYFLPYNGPKNQIFTEMKEHLEISSFYTCVPKFMIT